MERGSARAGQALQRGHTEPHSASVTHGGCPVFRYCLLVITTHPCRSDVLQAISNVILTTTHGVCGFF